ncbi:IS3 family transposase [Streptomyces sp. NPDC058240]|uniref:IS3 family transposase n=1 Tax=Streptomyces sp. NPDC058240 TaxID=3346396 RepID=UPI0036E3DDDE
MGAGHRHRRSVHHGLSTGPEPGPTIPRHTIRHPHTQQRDSARQTTRGQPETPLDIHRGINAAAESFWALLKEEIGTRIWPDRATARAEVFDFIETFYNRRRLRKHKVFGYLTPAETRQRHQHDLAA